MCGRSGRAKQPWRVGANGSRRCWCSFEPELTCLSTRPPSKRACTCSTLRVAAGILRSPWPALWEQQEAWSPRTARQTMLAIAAENCRGLGLENVSFEIADAHALPFPDEHFDRVTSKLGVMYFVDCAQSLGEIRRVLKPDGKLALLAWGSPDISPYIQATLGPVFERAQLPPPSAEVPQPFRFAQPGTLSAELEHAGFREVEEQTHVVPLAWPGPPEEVWEHLYDIAAPFRPVIDGLRPEDRDFVVRGGTREVARALCRWPHDHASSPRGCFRDSVTTKPGGHCGRLVDPAFFAVTSSRGCRRS